MKSVPLSWLVCHAERDLMGVRLGWLGFMSRRAGRRYDRV